MIKMMIAFVFIISLKPSHQNFSGKPDIIKIADESKVSNDMARHKPSVWEASGAEFCWLGSSGGSVDLIAIPSTPFNFHMDTAVGGVGVGAIIHPSVCFCSVWNDQ